MKNNVKKIVLTSVFLLTGIAVRAMHGDGDAARDVLNPLNETRRMSDFRTLSLQRIHELEELVSYAQQGLERMRQEEQVIQVDTLLPFSVPQRVMELRFFPSRYSVERFMLTMTEVALKLFFIYSSGPIPGVGTHIQNLVVNLSENLPEITLFAVVNMAEFVVPIIHHGNRLRDVFFHTLWMVGAIPALWLAGDFIAEHTHISEGEEEPHRGVKVFYAMCMHAIQYAAMLVTLMLYVMYDEFFNHQQAHLRHKYSKR